MTRPDEIDRATGRRRRPLGWLRALCGAQADLLLPGNPDEQAKVALERPA